MTWKVIIDNRARKELRKIASVDQERILKWIRLNLASDKDPRRLGKSLKGNMHGLWRYRIGDFRIICQIRDMELVILVIRMRHHRDSYV